MLERAIADLPSVGVIDPDIVVERTQGWTGAEIAIAVQEACSRSLLDGSDALRMDLLLEVIGERYTVVDEDPRPLASTRAIAIHEAGHAICGELIWPGQVKVVSLNRSGGATELDEDLGQAAAMSAEQLRLRAEMFAAGRAAERLILGADGITDDEGQDEMKVTMLAERVIAMTRGYEPSMLEGPSGAAGSERMRSGIHAEIEAEAHRVFIAAIVRLAPHSGAIEALAVLLLDHPEQALAGAELQDALRAAIGTAARDPQGSFEKG